ncbi:sensor histidine kinase [Methanosphaerula palustris]|uniref:sensor histidine kinase n=1 Tax=Methanosphaerula palustris TaxID=475088 RepID=UPI0001849432|nr:HAMP domain-containing sensor histidine kinase [Methanosphaerula palustris]
MPGYDERGSKREVSQEIADLKRIEKDLRHRNQQLNLLINVTHHDMRNKILAMQGYLDLARNETLDEESIASLIENLEGATREIQSQIEFVTIFQHHKENWPTWHHLVDLLPTQSIPSTILFQADLDGIEVYTDPLLEKVFSNLLDNSIRHGKRVTSVRVSTVESVNNQVIVWEDDGVGIPLKEKEKIFHRGYGKNTGFGTFLIREILSLVNSTITETGTPGAGARFEIVMPRGMFRRARQKRGECLSGINSNLLA